MFSLLFVPFESKCNHPIVRCWQVMLRWFVHTGKCTVCMWFRGRSKTIFNEEMFCLDQLEDMYLTGHLMFNSFGNWIHFLLCLLDKRLHNVVTWPASFFKTSQVKPKVRETEEKSHGDAQDHRREGKKWTRCRSKWTKAGGQNWRYMTLESGITHS